MRWLRFLLGLILANTPLVLAQNLSVTATITDSDGQTWNNGTWSAVLQSPNGKLFYNGVQINPQMVSGSLSNSGVLSANLYNTNTITPALSTYVFTICSQTSAPCSIVTTAVTTSNLSTLLSSLITAPRFSATPIAYGYLDAEISPIPNCGGQYFNSISGNTRQWNCTTQAWQNVGSGSGAGTVTNVSVADSNGFYGTVDNSATTPVIHIAAHAFTTGGTVQSSLQTALNSCATTPGWIQITSGISLTGSITIPALCTLWFQTGGEFVGSATVTVNGTILASSNQQIFGAGIVVTGLRQKVPLAWFGLVNDCYMGTGACTDQIMQLTTASNSLASGSCLAVTTAGYAFTGPWIWSNTTDGIGLCGVRADVFMDNAMKIGQSQFWNKSASTDTIQVIGSQSGHGYISGDHFEDVTFGRLVTPTGSAKGFNIQLNAGTILNRVTSIDSIYDFWEMGNPDSGQGVNRNGAAYWGGNTAITYTTGTTVYGIHVDGGAPPLSMTLDTFDIHDFTFDTSTPLNSIAYHTSGSNISDQYINNINVANTAVGVEVDCSTSSEANDIQIISPIFQAGTGLIVNGCTSAMTTNISVTGGWNGTTTRFADIESSTGVSITNQQFKGGGTVYVHNSSGNTISNNWSDSGGAVKLDSSSQNAISNNRFRNASSTAFQFVNASTGNTFLGNSTTGTVSGSQGCSFDSTSTGNQAINLNNFAASATICNDTTGGTTNMFALAANNLYTSLTAGWNLALAGNNLQWDFTGAGNFYMYNTNGDTNTNPFLDLHSRANGSTARSPIRVRMDNQDGHQTFSMDFNPENASMLLDNGFSSTLAHTAFQCYGGNATVMFVSNDGYIGYCDGSNIHWLNFNVSGYAPINNPAFTGTLTVGGTMSMLPNQGTTYGDVIRIKDEQSGNFYGWQANGGFLFSDLSAAFTGWYGGLGILSGTASTASSTPIFGINAADQTNGAHGIGGNNFNVTSDKKVMTFNNTLDDGTGNMFVHGGSNILYRCTTAGTLPVGALTTVTGNCGASADTGLRVN